MLKRSQDYNDEIVLNKSSSNKTCSLPLLTSFYITGILNINNNNKKATQEKEVERDPGFDKQQILLTKQMMLKAVKAAVKGFHAFAHSWG